MKRPIDIPLVGWSVEGGTFEAAGGRHTSEMQGLPARSVVGDWLGSDEDRRSLSFDFGHGLEDELSVAEWAAPSTLHAVRISKL